MEKVKLYQFCKIESWKFPLHISHSNSVFRESLTIAPEMYIRAIFMPIILQEKESEKVNLDFKTMPFFLIYYLDLVI